MTPARAIAASAGLLILLAGCGQEVGPVNGAEFEGAATVSERPSSSPPTSSSSSPTSPPSTPTSSPTSPSAASSPLDPSGPPSGTAEPSGTPSGTPSSGTPSGTADPSVAPDPSGTPAPGDPSAGGGTSPGRPSGGTPSPSAPGATQDGSATPGPTLDAPLTTVPAEVMVLPPASRAGTVPWQTVGFECDLGTPQAASAMRSDQEGDGAFERTATMQQVVAFGDVAAAVAEADRVAAAMRTCAQRPEHRTEGVSVGAQGVGLAFLYGPRVDSRDTAFGSYLVLTRRGNALSLTGQIFGEGSPESARSTATDLARQGWAELCVYDRTGGC